MSRYDAISFINALFIIFSVLVLIRIVFSWVGLPSQKPLYALFKFSYDTTEWYLRIFRRVIPTAGMIDFSPFIAMLVLWVIVQIIKGVILEI